VTKLVRIFALAFALASLGSVNVAFADGQANGASNGNACNAAAGTNDNSEVFENCFQCSSNSAC
jgi:prepilin-type processing-associated H-X9-DG protein